MIFRDVQKHIGKTNEKVLFFHEYYIIFGVKNLLFIVPII